MGVGQGFDGVSGKDTGTTEIYTLTLHDALPIFPRVPGGLGGARPRHGGRAGPRRHPGPAHPRAAPPGRVRGAAAGGPRHGARDRKSTRLNSSHANISYAVFCLKKKINHLTTITH